MKNETNNDVGKEILCMHRYEGVVTFLTIATSKIEKYTRYANPKYALGSKISRYMQNMH